MKTFKCMNLTITFLIGLISTQTISTQNQTNFLYTTFNTITNEANLFGKHFLSALIVHYCGQSCTNLLYKTVPPISESILRPGISLCQTVSSYGITNEVYNKISDHHHSFAHILGWVIATYLPKPASLVLNTLDYYRTSEAPPTNSDSLTT